ncbi:MAG: CoA transferase [Chloroflexota bacterium]|nr:MAG: CoA transferase [Chloroflexota bacterium]
MASSRTGMANSFATRTSPNFASLTSSLCILSVKSEIKRRSGESEEERTMETVAKPLPLEGIRVVEWAQWQQGPVAGMMLADLGADVIKIEEPVGGDPARGFERVAGLITFKDGRNAYFENNNRNKRSMALNLKTGRGLEIAHQLIEKSDVFLHNFLPRVVEKLGLDEDSLRKRNPRLIYAVASGYGSKGPDADTPSFDYTGLARSGIMTMVGEPDMPPLRIEGGIVDQMGAIMTAYTVLGALLVRERTGIAQRCDASLLGSMMWLQGLNVAIKLITGSEGQRTTRAKAPNPLWNYYKCADGKWIALAHLQADRFWPAFCKTLGIEHLEHDPRYANAPARRERGAELVPLIDNIFAQKPRAEWLRLLTDSGLICTQVSDFDDLVADPAALANEYITEYDHPSWGRLKTIGFPATYAETPCKVRLPAPEHGQHTEEILNEVLGYDWDEIVKLREDNII